MRHSGPQLLKLCYNRLTNSAPCSSAQNATLVPTEGQHAIGACSALRFCSVALIQHFLCARVTVTVGTISVVLAKAQVYSKTQQPGPILRYAPIRVSRTGDTQVGGWVTETTPERTRRATNAENRRSSNKQRTSARNTKSNRPSTVPPASNASKEAIAEDGDGTYTRRDRWALPLLPFIHCERAGEPRHHAHSSSTRGG